MDVGILYPSLDDGLKTVLKVADSSVQHLRKLLHHPLVNAVVVGTRRGQTAMSLRQRNKERKQLREWHSS